MRRTLAYHLINYIIKHSLFFMRKLLDINVFIYMHQSFF
jgi:hypothetical protein